MSLDTKTIENWSNVVIPRLDAALDIAEKNFDELTAFGITLSKQPYEDRDAFMFSACIQIALSAVVQRERLRLANQ